MKSLTELMSRFGAYFIPKNKFNFPLKLVSSELPIGINYRAGVSAQLKSAVILAGLNSYGNTKYMKIFKVETILKKCYLKISSHLKLKKNQKK